MDINSISSDLNVLQNEASNKSNKSSSASKINNNSKFLKLDIKEYNQKRDELSESLQMLNEGIGLSRTAQTALDKQGSNLQDIENKLTNLNSNQSNEEDKNNIKNEIALQLNDFKQIASQTTYKKENLLTTNVNEENHITISTKESYYSIDKPNTLSIVSSVAQSIKKNDFNDEEQLAETIENVQINKNKIENIKNDFNSFENNLQEGAMSSIQTQTELSKQNSIKNKVAIHSENTNFDKTNIQSNNGYLAASQANILQEQSIRLLS